MELVTDGRMARTLAKYRLVSEFAGSNVRIALDLERDGKEYLAVFQNENANGVTFRTGKSTLDLPHGSGGGIFAIQFFGGILVNNWRLEPGEGRWSHLEFGQDGWSRGSVFVKG